MGGFEASALAGVEPTLKYHPSFIWHLTSARDPGQGHCLAGSFTGAVASQKITEAPKGSLSLVVNQALSAKTQGSLTARPTSRAGAKAGLSDPTVACGSAVVHRLKGTPGITGLSCPRVHIDGKVWHLDVGSSHPGAVAGPKGRAVRPLKRHVSWVQNVVRQFGPYPSWALGVLRGSVPSTRGPGRTHRSCASCPAKGTAGWRRAEWISAESI